MKQRNMQHHNVSLQQETNTTLYTTMMQMQGGLLMMELERGPRYEAYAELRETKLRMRYLRQQQEQEQEIEYYEDMELEETAAKVPTPPRKQVKFQGGGRKGSSLLAQSVPDFSAALRKENRKPVNSNMLPTVMELTPPSKTVCGVLSSSRGSKSANAGEKRRGALLMPRKSYASIDELKSLSSSTANAINAESRARSSRVMGRKTVLSYRHI